MDKWNSQVSFFEQAGVTIKQCFCTMSLSETKKRAKAEIACFPSQEEMEFYASVSAMKRGKVRVFSFLTKDKL